MRGTTPPPAELLVPGTNLTLPTDDFENEKNVITILPGIRVFIVPIDRLCIEETVGLAFVEMLGLRGMITRLTQSAFSKPTSACINNRTDIGDLAPAYANLALRQQQIAQSCDIVLGSNDAGPAGETVHASFAATTGTSVLARAEWIKFIGAFFNREAAAEKIFEGISSRYSLYKSQVAAQFPSTGSASSNRAPVVVWIGYSAASSWGAASWSFSRAAYKAGLTADAGGSLYAPPPAPGNFAPNTVSYASVGEFLAALKAVPGGVQVVIDETYSATPATYTYAAFQTGFGLNASIPADVAAFPFLATQSVFRYDGLLGQDQAWDWYESAIPQADALLADMAQTVAEHTPVPSTVRINHKRVWMRNIALSENVQYTSAVCPAGAELAPFFPYEISDSEASKASDPAFVTACPEYLTKPWTVTQIPPAGSSSSSSSSGVASVSSSTGSDSPSISNGATGGAGSVAALIIACITAAATMVSRV